MITKKKKKSPRDGVVMVGRSASEPFLFDKQQKVYETPKNFRWVDELWRRMTLEERIETVVAFRDERGRGVLTWAVRNREYGLVEMLLENEKVEVNEQDEYGNTPLHHAVLVKDGEMLRILLKSKRVVPNVVNKAGYVVETMLREFEKSAVFDSSTLHYCYMRIAQLAY